jgi:N6-adenosine-specific RNA methylase IME4
MTLPARVESDRQLTLLEAARASLQQAADVRRVKQILDWADGARLYATRQRLSEETIGLAYALKIEALGKLGDMLLEMPKQHGARGIGPIGSQDAASNIPTFDELGIDRHTATLAQQIARLDAETRQRIAGRELKVAEALRMHRQTDRRARPLPAGVFRVVYADPPWTYGNAGVINEADGYGRAARHYATLTIAELCALPVLERVAADAVLFLWVTSPLLAECWPVITAWGFEYKTSIVWAKDAHNFGHYVSVQHELLLLCTRGSCLPDHLTPMQPSIVVEPRSRTHSEKPEIFRHIIDRLYDGAAEQKLELFARRAVPGWTSYGDEISRAGTL